MRESSTPLSGVLTIDKSAGITSHDVVAKVRRVLGIRQVGHTGTLDPFATGLLLVTVGSATRLMRYTHTLPKTYEATITLGAESDTDDLTGTITPHQIEEAPPPERVASIVATFIGTIAQVPPRYAAIKHQGKKLYEYARAGEMVPRQPRPITIHAIEILAYTYPTLTLRVVCSTGTYIRALGRDIGEQLHTGGYLTALRRTRIGNFDVNSAVTPSSLTPSTTHTQVQPSVRLVEHLPFVVLSPQNVAQFRQGRAVGSTTTYSGGTVVAVLTPNGELIGIAEIDAAGLLHPKTVL